MGGLITSVSPLSSEKFYGLCGVTCLRYNTSLVDNADKQHALSNAIESVVLGDARCREYPALAHSLVLFRGRSGDQSVSAQGLNKVLGVLHEPVLRIDGLSSFDGEVAVSFSFSLRPWHMERVWAIPGVHSAGYVRDNYFGRKDVLITLQLRGCDKEAFPQNLAQAVTAGLTF
jgi:hypothetical protein